MWPVDRMELFLVTVLWAGNFNFMIGSVGLEGPPTETSEAQSKLQTNFPEISNSKNNSRNYPCVYVFVVGVFLQTTIVGSSLPL